MNRIPNLPRTITKINYELLESKAEEIDWSRLYEITDLNIASEEFTSMLTNLIKEAKSTLKIPHKLYNMKPWITPSLIKCIKKRDYLHSKLLKYPLDTNLKIAYNKYRNTFHFIIQTLKNKHDQAQLEESFDNPKKTWRTLKTICNLGKPKTNCLDLLQITDSPLDSLNKVNQYFTSIGTE